MKTILALLVIVLLLGCSSDPDANVKRLKKIGRERVDPVFIMDLKINGGDKETIDLILDSNILICAITAGKLKDRKIQDTAMGNCLMNMGYKLLY